MKDPHVISSGAAHEVSVAPGSSVARSHVAVPRDTVIRQNAVVEPEYLDLGEPPERDTLAIGKPKPAEVVQPAPAIATNRGRLFTAEPIAPAAETDDAMAPEMNFPARLIHLKVENDKMREVLQGLERDFEAT
jgi:hypothetical protein